MYEKHKSYKFSLPIRTEKKRFISIRFLINKDFLLFNKFNSLYPLLPFLLITPGRKNRVDTSG